MAELVLPRSVFGDYRDLTFRLRIGSGVAEVAVLISHDGRVVPSGKVISTVLPAPVYR
ncbi:hypothetical protein [Pseudomonas brenneri]